MQLFSISLVSKKTLIVAVAVVIVASIPAVYFYLRYRTTQQQLANPTEFARTEARQLVAKVGKLVALPTDEEPTVAIVSDAAQLKEQAFFAKAKNGDRVLIYPSNRLAVLYDPIANKVLNMAPVNIGPSATVSGQAAGDQAGQPSMTVVLRNGTSTVGLTGKFEEELKSKAPNLTVVERENAQRRDWVKTTIIDVTGNKSAQANELAQSLDLAVGPLPDGEATPAADFLIILGEDRK